MINHCSWIIVVAILFSLSVQAQDKEFAIAYKNGKPYRVGKIIMGSCGSVLQETTYDANGNIVRQEEWQNGKRCGASKVFINNKLAKQVKFKKDLMVAYTSYMNDNIYTQISEDRKLIVNKGKKVIVNWRKFYLKHGSNRLAIFEPRQMIDFMSISMLPEAIAQAIADISEMYEGGNKVGDNAVLNCGGKTSVINDANADFKSTDSRKRKEAGDVTDMINSSCAANSGSSLTGSFNGVTGNYAERGRIDKARGAIDKMIQGCNSGSSVSSGGLVSISGFEGVATLIDLVYDLAQSGEAIAAETAFESAPTLVTSTGEITGSAVASGTGAAAGGSSSTAGAEVTQIIVRAGSAATTGEAVAAGVSSVPAGTLAIAVTGSFLAGVGIGMAVTAVSDAIGRAIDNHFNKENPPASGVGGGSGGANGGGVKRPDPNNDAGGCDRLKSFKKYCDNNGWQDMKCQDAARLISGCVGDIREMYVAGDGNVSGVGCPSAVSPEEIARMECKAKGMVAMPVPGGSVCRSKGKFDGAIPNPGLDPRIINPTRGDFRTSFDKTSVKVVGSGIELENVLKNAKRPIMVVFMDPDCPSCQTFTQSLKSTEVATATNNVDVLVVDASALPEVMVQNNISAFPSYFILRDGKKSTMTIGTMTGVETANFMNVSR